MFAAECVVYKMSGAFSNFGEAFIRSGGMGKLFAQMFIGQE